MIRNYIELAVEETLDDVLNRYALNHPGTCTCARCRLDIMAIALNNLPTRYVVTDVGGIFTKVALDQVAGRAQVIAAILNAIPIVQKNPRHETKE
ncbi:late competence development ComFB family protein [Desulforamulus ruminis]|uniref:Late competence development protein ComFB n=1 Tax=Desulforamulus ruminis (strain ATCC 23193 / DSM 2154 / NCIMB 8452 / DL) TaxID=696281 RepID=F6DKP9_DESRL|nr:late competence development ComFB family protein [Desulforamulus ruminis]AEG60424.1 Late competence development protein ComFB [Desulforamulus ruminis DSM 2154]